jgi:N,N'-diacetyllegionaminate synthase
MEKTVPLLIFECANAHGGDFETLRETIARFSSIVYPDKHIKFQIFHPDKLSLPDYSWYPVYWELMFEPAQWSDLIRGAGEAFDGVWLDVSDRYGTEILAEHDRIVTGLKLQASVLENAEALAALRDVSLRGKSVILNVSGYAISEIESFARVFSGLEIAELILQVGHQAYPTRVEDTGLQKVRTLRAAFPGHRISIADHAPATDDLACILPLMAVGAGCSVVEKHVCLDRSDAKYDHFSSLEPREMQLLANRLAGCVAALDGPFISASERDYLAGSIQVPVAVRVLPAGSLISPSDVVFRRTAQSGLRLGEIVEVQERRSILANAVAEHSTVQARDLRPARVGVIVACRMKSSRLKQKALVPIEGRASVERCLDNCLAMPGVEVVVLATSTEEEDRVLEGHTLDGQVGFWRGDPDDVIQRYLGACEAYGIDVVVRVTADCPVASPEIADRLLRHHFRTGADFTTARSVAVGTGCEIYNRETLERVLSYVGQAEYAEYMNAYVQNNPEVFKVEIVDLPTEMVRDYRLTLDYPEDLEMFSRLYQELGERGEPPFLANVFRILDENPKIPLLNAHKTLRYRTDQELIDRINRASRIGAERV